MSPKSVEIDPERLKAARHAQGLSLRELGEQVGMDHNLIWLYEDGRRNPIPRNIRRLADALGVEVRDLLKERR
jgi:transcriptional regulator with XRE-family HTH domain